MGDSGSLTLGFILGFLTVKLSMDNPNVMPLKDDNRLLIAYSLLIVPMFDVVRVSLIRLRHLSITQLETKCSTASAVGT